MSCELLGIFLYGRFLLSTYLFSYLYQYMDSWIFYPLGYNIVIFILLFKLSCFGHRNSSSWLLCSFAILYYQFFKYLYFWHHKMRQAYLIYSLSQSQNQPFLQGALTNILLIHLSWRMTAHLFEEPSRTLTKLVFVLHVVLCFKSKHSKYTG